MQENEQETQQGSEMLLLNTPTHTHGNNRAKINDRGVSVCVRTVCIGAPEMSAQSFITRTPRLSALLWPLLPFYGLTCHDRGMTATLTEREGRKREMEWMRDVVFREGGRGECQLKSREEMKGKQ